jgi:hypothetical protein
MRDEEVVMIDGWVLRDVLPCVQCAWTRHKRMQTCLGTIHVQMPYQLLRKRKGTAYCLPMAVLAGSGTTHRAYWTIQTRRTDTYEACQDTYDCTTKQL